MLKSFSQTLNSLGTHDELIKDPEGAYTQLVRMQENAKQSEASQGAEKQESSSHSHELERSLSRSDSLRLSMRKSTSNDSSRHSFAVYGVTGGFDPHAIPFAEDGEESSEGTVRKIRNAPFKRLMSLNSPEWPYLLLGALAAGVQGVVFPMFGLLLSTAIKIFFEPPQQLKKDSIFWGFMMVVLGLTTLVALPIQSGFFGVAGGKLIQRVRSLSFKKVVHQEISWFDDPANSR